MKHLFPCWFVLILINTCDLLGQSDYFSGPIFHNITVDDGLAHRTVNTIIQDREGYIWMGTNNGLHRYDGQKMKVYQWDIKDIYGLPDNRIQRLFLDKKGRLWILSEDGDLARRDPAQDRFVVIKLSGRQPGATPKIRNIAEDVKGNIWILATDNEIYQMNPNQNTFAVQKLFLLGHIPKARLQINKIIIDRQNRLWAETVHNGIHLYSILGDDIEYMRHFKDLGNLKLINQDSEKRIWFSNAFKIYMAKQGTESVEIKEFCDLKKIFPDLKGDIRAISTDQNGQIWAATFGSGLFQLKENGGKIVAKHYPGEPGTEKGLTNNHLTHLFIDRYNVLWIGSQAGLFWNHLNQKPFYKISKIDGKEKSLINNIVHAVYRDQYLWIGTRNGLSVIDTATNQFFNYRRLSPDLPSRDEGGISCLLKDDKDRLWVGANFAGLFIVQNREDPARLNFIPLKTPRSSISNLSSDNIIDLVQDEWGRIWVGAANDGVFFLTNDQKEGADFYEFTQVENLQIKALTNLYKDPYENAIWAGSWENGLVKISLLSRKDYKIDYFQKEANNVNSLRFNHVNPIVKTNRQTLWAGTIGGGLNKLVFVAEDSVQYSHFTTHDGLPDNTIHSILKDDSGKLWLGGTGLARFDPETEKIMRFDTHDGLQSNLFIVNSDFKDQAGRLYFGGPYGLNFFNPDDIRKEKSFPDVVLSDLKIRNKEIKVGEKINGRILLSQTINHVNDLVIKEKENDLTIGFLAIHTAIPSKNQLKYRLQGYQNDWIEIDDSEASVTYSNLRPGNYSFQVMASNGDGVWKPGTTNLNIKIIPHWYKSKLAYIIYALFFLFLLWLFRRTILIQSELRNNLKIAQIELEKDQELAEMKTRFFNNITHELRSPLTLIKGPVEELLANEKLDHDVRKNYYHIIYQNAGKLFRLVNRLLDFRKAESGHFQLEAAEGDFISFAKEIYLSFRQLAKDQALQYTFETKYKELSLFYDRDKMEIVLCNLLSNAFKYSNPGGEIKLAIRREDKHCIVEVSDSGKGMSSEEVDNIFNRFYQIAKIESSDIIGTGIGLAMVKSIVDLHQGEIAVQTQKGRGSAFTLRLPLGKSHLTDDQITPDFVNGEHINHYQPISKAAKLSAYDLKNSEQVQKMLIVEDNPEIRTFLKSIFSDQFVVQEAAHGLEGLRVLKNDAPDIIISDVMMDHMDGIAFCNKIKEDPAFFHIPFILLTARTSNVYKVDGLSSGADAYITKPFNAQVLKAQVSNLLKTRASLKEYYTNRITLGSKKMEVASGEIIFLEELIAIIEENLEEEDLTVESLASAMAMSRSTLYRKVKSYTGESINSFIRSIRLKRAAQWLSDPELNISQIAYKAGFSDVNYFGKCFKQQFTMSPTDYIKSLSRSKKAT